MQLSLKQKTFSDVYIPFVESISNFQNVEKKDDRHSFFITEFTVSE